MERRQKDIVSMATQAGLDPVRYSRDGSRVWLEARAPNGVVRKFSITSAQRNDVRGDLNELSEMRRFARQNPAPTEVPTSTTETKGQNRMPIKPPKTGAAMPPVSHPPYAPQAPSVAKAGGAKDLLPAEMFRLCVWLKALNLQEVPSFDALSMLVSREHGEPVPDETTRMLMEATETAEPEHWKPPADPLAVVARSMVELMKSLGQEPTAALLKIAA